MGRWTGKPRSKRVRIGCGNCGIQAKIKVQGAGEVRQLGLTHRDVQHGNVTRQRAQMWNALPDDATTDDDVDGDD